jgi:hypothetical protein
VGISFTGEKISPAEKWKKHTCLITDDLTWSGRLVVSRDIGSNSQNYVYPTVFQYTPLSIHFQHGNQLNPKIRTYILQRKLKEEDLNPNSNFSLLTGFGVKLAH